MSRFPSYLPAIEFWICVNGSIQDMTFSLQLRIILLIIHVRQLVLHPVQIPVIFAKRVTTSANTFEDMWKQRFKSLFIHPCFNLLWRFSKPLEHTVFKGVLDWTAEGEPGAGISKHTDHKNEEPWEMSMSTHSQLLLLLASLVSSTLSFSILSYSAQSYSILSYIILSYSILSFSILSYFIVWVTKSLYMESLPTRLPLIGCHHFSNLLTLPFRRGTLLSPIEHWWSSPAKSQILCGDRLKGSWPHTIWFVFVEHDLSIFILPQNHDIFGIGFFIPPLW